MLSYSTEIYSVLSMLHKYIQFFLESVEGDNVAYNCSNTTKEVMVLPSLQAKDHSMNKMKEYIEHIKQTSLYGDKENIYNKFIERIKHEIGDIEDQCGSMGLDLHFRNAMSFENENKIERVYQTTISGKSSHPNAKMNIDISYRKEFCSTLSGIVQCDEDLYLITTGHGMSDRCTVDSKDYELVNKMWPQALESKDADRLKKYKYGGILSGDSMESFVSDVAILKPKTADLFGKYSFSKELSYVKLYDEPYPGMIVPSMPVINEAVHVLYSGCKTKDKMKVVGSGYFKQLLGKLWIYERFYIAIPYPSDNLEWFLGTTMTEECDSVACVTTAVEDKIDSFVIGKIDGPEQFRLLSPAHFVLEHKLRKTFTQKQKKCEICKM
jgi:hypothetical protein